MLNETQTYEKWAPKMQLYILLGLGLTSLVCSLFPPVQLFVRLILWNFAAIAFLGFLGMMYLYRVSKGIGNQFQQTNPQDLIKNCYLG